MNASLEFYQQMVLLDSISVSFNARVNSLNKEMLFPHLEKILWEGEFTLRSDP